MSPSQTDIVSTERKRKSKVQPAEIEHPAKKAKNNLNDGSSATPAVSTTNEDADTKWSANKTRSKPKAINGHKSERRPKSSSERAAAAEDAARTTSQLVVKPHEKKHRHTQKSKEARILSPEHRSSKAKRDSIQVGSKTAVADAAPKLSRSTHLWHLSEPLGGRFSRLDPCFSKDERHILLATRHRVLVYSASNSLLHCKILISDIHPIVALALSETNHNLAFVATADGTVTLIEWFAGRQLYSVNYGCQIVAMVPVAIENNAADTLFLIVKSRNDSVSQSHVASITFAHEDKSAEQPNLDQLSSTTDSIQHLQVLNGGRVVFAASRTTVLLGWSPIRRGKAYMDGDESLKHMWKTVDFSEGLTCIHARYFPNLAQEDADRKHPVKGNTFSLAIGSESGIIYLYDNILDVFRGHESNLMKPRRLHWHRNPVGALKWSLDGNYLISGGRETVLLIWQLDTSRRQDLPHLTAEIEGITVSPSGTSYAIHLGDNSVMILSTSELAPKAIMSGLQSKVLEEQSTPLKWDLNYSQTSVVENPVSPDQLLLVVPASSGSSSPWITRSTSFLQTFDTAQSRSVSRQALSRNNAVNINKAPAGHPIQEVTVQKVAISSNGQWLATIEEWSPPPFDIKDTIGVVDAEEVKQERRHRRETYLKFWKFDNTRQQWSLHARIDAPHKVDWEPECSKIIDIVQIPGDQGFATVGEDSIVRLWTPKTRLRDGSIKRGVHEDGQTTWSCSSMLNIERTNLDSGLVEDEGKYEPCKRASLAFSMDGTILAISIDGKSGLVHFFDASTGRARLSIAGMYSKDLVDMKFLGKHLVVVADGVRVWDITTNQLVFDHSLHQGRERPESVIRLLAVNEASGKFAVCSTIYLDGKLGSRILVFDPTSNEPIYQADEPDIITALTTSKATSNFFLLNARAELRTLQAAGSQPIVGTAFNQVTTHLQPSLSSTADTTNDGMDAVGSSANRILLTLDDYDDNDVDMERTFVRGNQLAQLFEDMRSHALPPVQDMFHAVAKLYIGKNQA